MRPQVRWLDLEQRGRRARRRRSQRDGHRGRGGPDDETAELITRRGWRLVETYTDHGVSGSRESRPALDRLLADARNGRFDAVVTWRADRLFRSLRAMVNTLDEWNALGVGFVSATEIFDSRTPQGRLLMHLTSAFAEFERSVIAERTRAGIAAARRRGARVGRPPARLDDRGLRELRASGMSVREIAATVGCVAEASRTRAGGQPRATGGLSAPRSGSVDLARVADIIFFVSHTVPRTSHVSRRMTDMTPVVSVVSGMRTNITRMMRSMSAMRIVISAGMTGITAVTWNKSAVVRDTSALMRIISALVFVVIGVMWLSKEVVSGAKRGV
jgi:DNA invertase Pin-like site-specific DNA recombinase